MNLSKLIVTWFAAGTSKVAPGTAGSLAALPFVFILQHIGGFASVFVFSIAALIVGTYATHLYLAQYPEKSDPKEVVIDEVAGQSLVLCMLAPTLPAVVAGFVLFRFFDVVKPWPISLADKKVKGATGVMLDDMLAAIFALATLFACHYLTTQIEALSPYSKTILQLFANVS